MHSINYWEIRRENPPGALLDVIHEGVFLNLLLFHLYE